MENLKKFLEQQNTKGIYPILFYHSDLIEFEASKKQFETQHVFIDEKVDYYNSGTQDCYQQYIISKML